MKIIP